MENGTKKSEGVSMARPGVTYFDVSNAAQQLIAAGKTPTIESIRIALGTGSNSTLGSHLRTWKSNQGQTHKIATKENIPEELVAALKGVWDRVMNQSEDKIQTIQQETQQEILQLKQEIQNLQKENAHHQQQNQLLKQERDSFYHDKSVIEQVLNESRIEGTALTEKYAALEKQNQDKQELVNELRRQNQQIQTNLEHYRNASLEQRLSDQQKYEQQQKQLELINQQLNQELTQSRNETLSLQQKNKEVIFENNYIKEQINKLEVQNEQMVIRITDSHNELKIKLHEQKQLQGQFQMLQEKYNEQNQLITNIKTQHALLLQQSEILKSECNELCEKNKLLAQEKWELGQEKAQLYGQLKQLESCI